MTIAIRKADSADAASLTEISHAAKRYWGYPEHWIQHWSSDLTITADYILSNEVYVAADGDEIQGFYALTVSHEKVELDHLWLRPEYIGQGLGKELFIHALNLAATLGANAVEITADPNAAGFYERMGAVKVGELRSELDGRPRNLPRLVIDPRRS